MPSIPNETIMAITLPTQKLRILNSSIFIIGSGTRRSHQTKMPSRMTLDQEEPKNLGTGPALDVAFDQA